MKPTVKSEPKAKEPERKPEDKDTKVQALLKERLATLRDIAAMTDKLYKTANISLQEVLQAKLQLHKAELELCESDKERIGVHVKIVHVAKDLGAIVARGLQEGNVPPVDALKAKANRLEAEIALERAKSQVTPQPR